MPRQRCTEWIILVLSIFVQLSSAADSEGTLWFWAFIRNANPDITNQTLSVTALNGNNNTDCQFFLTYRPDYHKATPPKTDTYTVKALSSSEIPVPNWYGFNYSTPNGPQGDVYLTLTANSTCPLTLLANNYDSVTGQGDTFLVYPATWSANNPSYTFTLPPSAPGNQHYEQLIIIPTKADANVTITETDSGSFDLFIKFGNSPAAYLAQHTGDKKAKAYRITSNNPIAVVAGVTCAGNISTYCDHVSFMPEPVPSWDCTDSDYFDDDHSANLDVTNQFYIDPPFTCTIPQQVKRTLSNGASVLFSVSSHAASNLFTIDRSNVYTQRGVTFHTSTSNVHVSRFYDGSLSQKRGAFMMSVPTLSQFIINQPSTFYTRFDNDGIEVFCNITACSSLYIDGQHLMSTTTNYTLHKIDDVTYYVFTVNVANQGFHQITLNNNGRYSFSVYGKNGTNTYGYQGAVNIPKVVLADNVTITSPQPTSSPIPTSSPTTGPPQSTQSTQQPPATSASVAPSQSTTQPQTQNPPLSSVSTQQPPASSSPPPTQSSTPSQAPPASTSNPPAASSTNPPVTSPSSPQPIQSSSTPPSTQPSSSPQPTTSPSSTKPTVPPAVTSTTTYFTTATTPGFASQRHLPWSTTVISLLAALLCIFACR